MPSSTHQQRFEILTRGRGSKPITRVVQETVGCSRILTGVVHIFVQHTTCSLMITENSDPTVRKDLDMLARHWAPDGDIAYQIDPEIDDDMAAHARSVLTGSSVSVPCGNGSLLLGTWQGIYIWEHRTTPQLRSFVVTVVG